MKCHRYHWGSQTWAQVRKGGRMYKRNHWRNTCPYTHLRVTTARAIEMRKLKQFREWKATLPNEYKKKAYFSIWSLT